MDIRTLDPEISVTPQIDLADLPAIRDRGFRSVISNRPDGESPDQPDWRRVEAAAHAAGLEARHLPVVSGQIGDDQVARFGQMLDELPGPVLAFCRTGTRSANLWARARAGTMPDERIVEAGRQAGYDLTAAVRRS